MKIVAAAVLAATTCSSAMAAGFMLTEQSVTGLGRSYAGAGIVGDDNSAVWYNPAGMTLLSGTQFQMGGVFVTLDFPLETTDGSYTDNGRKYSVPIPHMFFTSQLNDDMWFGFGLTVPYGMSTEYKRNSPLNEFGMNAEVKVFDLNPNLAWKINDKVSFGAGVSLQYATAQFESAKGYSDTGRTAPVGGYPIYAKPYGRLNADSLAWGFNMGVMWSPVETVRLGLAYRSAINHHAEGKWRVGAGGLRVGGANGPLIPNSSNSEFRQHTVGHSNNGSADLTAPQTVLLTGTWEVTEALRLSALIRWSDWSSFKSLDIKSGSPYLPGSKVENRWNDTWLFTLGADYTINDEWTVRAGVGYENGAVDDEYRTAVIPDADRLWLSCGASWNYDTNWKFDLAFTYLHGMGTPGLYKDHDKSQKVAEFKALDAYLVGAQFTYKF